MAGTSLLPSVVMAAEEKVGGGAGDVGVVGDVGGG